MTTPTMTIGVVFALEAEWAPWRSRHAFRAAASGGTTVYEGSIGDSRARVALGAVGVPHAAHLIDAVCADRVDALLAVGLAGALRDIHRCRDVIVARRAQSVASGASVASDPWLVGVATQCGAGIVEVLLCADRVAGRVEEKRRLAAHGDAVDMESFRIMQEARHRGIPSAAVRVIGDSAGEALPLDFNRALRADGTVDLLNLTGQALRHPFRWPAVVSFGYRQRSAVRALAAFLDRFVTALGASIE